MDELHLLSSSPTFNKRSSSPARQRTDSSSVIQQSDVSSSRPALLAQDSLGPLLFEALDGFFFTINHNFELDFVSDNVSQYLNFSQEELAGRNLYQCVHPSDVSEFSQVWTKKDAGESLTATTTNNGESSRGKTFLCRMRTNDEANPYLSMLLSVALHRDSSTSDKTFLICIARRSISNEMKDKSTLLGFDQFSSRINLQYDIESFDGSHMKHQTLDLNYQGKNFRHFVHTNDLPLIMQHFQEVIEKGESKSAIYRFRLHDDLYAFVISQSKLFNNGNSSTADCIMSTHTIIRLSENPIDLNGNASTRLVKSIVASQRDLQKNKQTQASPSPRTPACTPPIGTNFALTMFGMHRNPSNSLQQHVSNTLGSLAHVQSSFSGTTNSPLDKSLNQTSIASPARTLTQKPSILDGVSSSEPVEFGSNRVSFSPSFGSVHSNPGPLTSPINNTFDSILSPSNDFDLLFAPTSPSSFLPKKSTSSPTDLTDFSTNEVFANPNLTNSINTTANTPATARTSLRLRRLLTTKSPPITSPSPLQGLISIPDLRSHSSSNQLDDSNPTVESPTTTTYQSPLSAELPSPNLRRRKPSQTNGGLNSSSPAHDLLLKQILNRQTPMTNNTLATSNATNISPTENNTISPSIKTESITNDENTANGQTTNNSPGATNKLRSDIFLRTLLKDEVRPQKVVVEPPFIYATRAKPNGRASGGATLLLGPTQNRSIGSQSRSTGLKSQMSLDTIESAIWDTKGKKKRQNSHTFGSRTNSMTSMLAANATRKSARTKRDTSDYLIGNPTMDNSLDSFFDTPDGSSTAPKSPIGLQRPVRQASISAMGNLKRLADQEESMNNPRKYPRLLTQALKDDVKVESTDQTVISPSVALAATRPLHQTHLQIKTEPELIDPIGTKRTATNLSSTTQSSLLRELIRTNQTGTTKKDAPLYDLLQNLDSNDTSIFSTINSISRTKTPTVDPLEQYLTSSTPPHNNTKTTSKDDYLAALLSADPQQPSEISFVPLHKQQSTPTLQRSASSSSDTSRIAAMVNDLFNATASMNPNATNPPPPAPPTITTAATTNPSDDLFSLLDNKDFFECLNDSSAIDSLLSENQTSILSTNPSNMSIPSTPSKHSEKDEKAISEIYKTLVTSFNPGPSTLDLPVDNSPFNSLTGDFLFIENPSNSAPPNRTVTMDSLMSSPYRPANNFSYQQTPAPPPSLPPPPHPQAQQTQVQPSSNTSQFSDCLSMDMIDNNNTFPPNVSLSPMTNTYHPSSTNPSSSHMDPSNSMMMYPQSTPTHIQHHQANNSMNAHYYRQTPIYNNYSSAPPNQVAPQTNYYPMQQQQQQQVRLPSGHHPSQMGQRATGMMHPQQRSSLLPSQQTNSNNQQVQLHMSMNVTLPHVNSQQNQQRAMMNTYNDLMHPTNTQDFSTYPSNNSLDHSFGHDLFMSPSPASQQAPPPSQQQQQQQQQQPSSMMHQRHLNNLQQQQQSYSNMNMVPTNNLNPMECRHPDDLNNQIMNSSSFQPTTFTREFVRKQLQNTIQGRQKPSNAGKDISSTMVAQQKMMNPTNNLDGNQKGAYFRHQLATSMSTPPLQNPLRLPPQQQQQQQQQTQQQTQQQQQQQNKPPM